MVDEEWMTYLRDADISQEEAEKCGASALTPRSLVDLQGSHARFFTGAGRPEFPVGILILSNPWEPLPGIPFQRACALTV